MKKSFFLAGCFAIALFFAACGDDSSSGNNVDQEMDESSSSVGDSTEVSSSAVYVDPSWPEGARAATLDDMNKYLVLKIKGEEFHLETGAKAGLFSLWAIDKVDNNTHLAVLLTKTDFKNGIVTMDSTNSIVPLQLDASLASNKVLENAENSTKPIKISFIMDGETLKYREGDKGDFVKAEEEQFKADRALTTDAGKLDKKRLVCKTSGKDTTLVYSFYKGRYVLERVVGKDTVSWNAGYVDTYRGYTFLWAHFSSKQDMLTATYQITSTLDTIRGNSVCTPSDFKYDVVDAASLAGEWAAFDSKANMEWSLELDAQGTYSLKAAEGASENKEGNWDVYGNNLFLSVKTMLDYQKRCPVPTDCANSIKGVVSGISEDGFTYNHSEKGTPTVPKKWEVPLFE